MFFILDKSLLQIGSHFTVCKSHSRLCRTLSTKQDSYDVEEADRCADRLVFIANKTCQLSRLSHSSLHSGMCEI